MRTACLRMRVRVGRGLTASDPKPWCVDVWSPSAGWVSRVLGWFRRFVFVAFMILMTWNCQGAGSKEFLRAAHLLINTHKLDILVLLETKVSGARANEVCKNLRFDSWFRIESIGYSGGIWILVKNPMNIALRYTHPQFAILDVNEGDRNWNLVVVYASPDGGLREKLWSDLNQEKLGLTKSWLVAGDFNTVMSADEVSNQGTYNERRSKGLKEWVFREGLVDPGYSGPTFTWIRGKDQNNFKGARLDRTLCTPEFLEQFPRMKVKNLPMIKSDHSPVLITLEGDKTTKKIRFKFQAAWLDHPEFHDLIETTWKRGETITNNVGSVAVTLEKWNRERYGNIFKRKAKLMARLEGIQRAMSSNPHAGLINLRRKLHDELEATLYQEELWWFQKSREEWICSGDRNTRYYHMATRIKRARNNISQLKDEQGNWVQDEDGMKRLCLDYFTMIFSQDAHVAEPENYVANFPRIETAVWDYVNSEFSPEEVRRAVNAMAPLKAPGPDGFHALFYQREWNTVGDTVVNQVKEFMDTGNLPTGINDTLIALVPKVPNPEKVNQFRPISLCNVNYKIITKAMTTRIKEVMRSLVGPEQSSFVPNRQITDNIVIYQEVMQSFHKKRGNKGMMAIKIDLEKAYDRLSWDFIKDTLQKAGFNTEWVRNIMACVTTSRLSILWNGDNLDWIVPTRGVRQGDAISPYLFVLCIERLGHAIKATRESGRWKGITLGRYGPILTHLMFAVHRGYGGASGGDQAVS